MTWILGVSGYYHDSAVTLVRDGELIAAASEERFTRKKHDAAFPKLAMKNCLEQASIKVSDLDYVGFYEKPLLKFNRLLETYLAYAPQGYRSFSQAMPQWLQTKLHLPRVIRGQLGGDYRRRILFAEHHQSHAASAFFPSPFDEAAILVMDGVGEWATTSWGTGNGSKIQLRQEIRFPHSLGLLYSAFTYFCGFRVNSGEYKLMGLAPYGQPVYADLIREHLIQFFDDGSYQLQMEYFPYGHALRMTDQRLEKLLGVTRREPEQPVRQEDMDLAASIQQVTEEAVLRLANHVHDQTGLRQLCLAGGVALNCVANGRLLREGPFDNIWIQPASGDAGGSLGIALWIWHQILANQRLTHPPADTQKGSLLGPPIGDASELESLHQDGAVSHRFEDEESLCERVAELLANANVVGMAHGRMEFGPRALGSRSILGDPRDPEMQTKMNLKIKYRESFRPFAPSVLREYVKGYFNVPDGAESPYMLMTFDVAESRRRHVDDSSATGIERVRQVRSDLPAITHLDHSARVQTVSEERHPRLTRVLQAFEAKTGCPVLINTSFNVRGEPIVCNAEDAYRCFLATQMDALVIGSELFLRSEQPASNLVASSEYLEGLEPD